MNDHHHIRRVEDVDAVMDMAEDVEEEDLVEGAVEEEVVVEAVEDEADEDEEVKVEILEITMDLY